MIVRRSAAAAGLAATVAFAVACGGEVPRPTPASILIEPGAVLFTAVPAIAQLRATVLDDAGAELTGLARWSTQDPTVATVDEHGLVRSVAEGRTVVEVRAGDVLASAVVETYLPEPWSLQTGMRVRGRNDYVEYLVGELPVVISAPHGGYETPDEIPDRTFGVVGQDRQTQEVAEELADAFERSWGSVPHVVINRLHRSKLDANREIVEAAQASPFAELAWTEYQELIDSAKARIVSEYGAGLFIDIHGHGHAIQRIELGYLLSAADLNSGDASIDQAPVIAKSSLRRIAGEVAIPFSALIRGPSSFGALLEAAGEQVVPSPGDPSPLDAPYFTGGYNTQRHGSRDGGQVDGIQVELNWIGVRDSDVARRRVAESLAAAAADFLAEHFAIVW